MNLKYSMRMLWSSIRLPFFRLRNLDKEEFTCPICEYRGPFEDVKPPTGLRRHARCPKCRSLERHRLQYLVVTGLLERMDTAVLRMLHFAPEPFFRKLFSERFGRYEAADLKKRGVDHRVDLGALPFEDGAYDFVFASHVLEHVRDDGRALSEIRRVLGANGIAVLPVPVVAEKTVEFPEPNPRVGDHVRAPGFDYFDRYERYFSTVDRIGSDAVPSEYQPFLYEDRTGWPTEECPWRPPMKGERHIEIVPVCHV